MCIFKGFKIAFQFELKSERSQGKGKATRMAEKKPPPDEGPPSRRRVRYYRQEQMEEDRAYQAMNVDLSTVSGPAYLMAAAVLRTVGNLEGRNIRLWGQLAFGELQEGGEASLPIDDTIRDMLFIDGRLYGYDLARNSFTELQRGDDYQVSQNEIPNPVIPARAENRRRRSLEDVNTQRIESSETSESSWCENCKCKRVKEVDQKKDEKHANKSPEPKNT